MSDDEELELLLEERDRYIDELEAELTGQEGDNEKIRDELILQREKIVELEAEVKQLGQEKKDLEGEKTQLEDQANAHKTQLSAQKNILTQLEDSKRIQKDGNQHLQRLETENQRLRDTVLEIEENEDILVNEIENLVEENSQYRAQNEELQSKCDSLYAGIDENTRLNSQLTQAKEKAENDLETQNISHAKSQEEWQQKDAASRSEIARILRDVEQERARHKESAHVKENEAFRQELIKVRRENQQLHLLHDRCLRDKNQAERDLDSAIQALNEAKLGAKEQIASERRKERVSTKEANAKLDTTQQRESALRKRCADTEEQLVDLRRQFERLEERNSAYEKNQGLTEAIRCQNQLEADIRRRDYDLKCLNETLGVTMEKNRALIKACDWLKEKANLEPDFAFDDEEIKLALTLEDNSLKCENDELSRQTAALEDERTKLLSQLRERAMEIGDRGVRFLGMSSEQISQVMEFASNLRRGTAELPLNDRSKELLSEVSSLKSDREVQAVTIERLEREIFSLSETGGEPRGAGLVLKQALDDMTSENKKLRGEIDALKAGGGDNSHGSALTPSMLKKAEDLLGEVLAAMPAAAEVQFLCLMNKYDEIARELKRVGEQSNSGDICEHVECNDNENVNKAEIPPHESDIEGEMPPREIEIENYQQCIAVVNERNQKLTDTVSIMEANMQKLRNERDIFANNNERLEKLAQSNNLDAKNQDGQLVGMISEISALTIKCKCLQEQLTKEKGAGSHAQRDLAELRAWKLSASKIMDRCLASLSTVDVTVSEEEIKLDLFGILQGSGKQDDEPAQLLRDGAAGNAALHDEIKDMTNSLQTATTALSSYIDDVTQLRSFIYYLQEKCDDSSKVAVQVSCLNDIINEKNRILKQTKERLTVAKQMNAKLIHDKEIHYEKKSDRSISTNSIDRSIRRAAASRNTPTRHLQNATALALEKDNIILDQQQTILELREELASGGEARHNMLKENERMKTDVSTLVERLAEAESDINAVQTYEQKCHELQKLLESNKKETGKIKVKLQSFEKERAAKDAKIEELKESVSRAKRVLSVARQGRARSEESLKTSLEEVKSLKEQLEKLEEMSNAWKREKIEAQNEKIKLSRKARISATKMKDLTDEHERKENSKTVEELDKRVAVLNKTVHGLTLTNSKLRGELAALKLSKKKVDEDVAAAATHKTARSSVSRDCSTPSSRASSPKAQIISLQKSLTQEKKQAMESSLMLEKYQKRICALEQALRSATRQNVVVDPKDSTVKRSGPGFDEGSMEEVQQKLLSLTNENDTLKVKVNDMKEKEMESTGKKGNETLIKQLGIENSRLKKENERLSQIDHLDFFEEIEDLKYKYNEAVRQINQLTTGPCDKI